MSEPINPEWQAALAHCDRELVHLPGGIQPCGALLAFDATLNRALKASDNLAHYLGVGAEEALGRSCASLLGELLAGQLQDTLDSEDTATVLTTDSETDEDSPRLQLTAHRAGDDVVILEIETLGAGTHRRWLAAVNKWLAQMARAEAEQELLGLLVRAVQDFAGHERVMVYRFDEHWHGTVVAESCDGNMASFLEHRFPASDIPPQVRALYDANPVRSIPDTTATPVALVPREEPGAAGNLDMSRGLLRAVAPVHLKYLENMGVRSSLSIAIHGPEQLWGLVACHGAQPRPLPPQARDAALGLVRMASQRLFLLKARNKARYVERVQNSRQLLSEKHGKLVTPEQLVGEYGDEWLGLFRACGLALVDHRGITCRGHTPDAGVIRRLVTRLTASHQQHGPWFSSGLSTSDLADAGDLADCCGLLALPLHIDSPPGWLLLFRKEQLITHQWAGAPWSSAASADQPLSPRHSFQTWQEEVRERSLEWRSTEIQAALDLAEDLAVATSVRRIARLNEQLEQANRQLSEMAQTDALTQVWNRYHLEKTIEIEFAAAERYGRPCSIILLDVDHFKQFNDRHGHEAGDRVLTTLAAELGSRLRQTDQLGRWGGEEFIVVAGNSTLESTLQLAERLREHVGNIDLGALGRLTFSAGVAEWRPGDTPRSLVERADRAMYRAKESGRDRVCPE